MNTYSPEISEHKKRCKYGFRMFRHITNSSPKVKEEKIDKFVMTQDAEVAVVCGCGEKWIFHKQREFIKKKN